MDYAEKEQYRDSLGRFVEGYNWRVYATLTFEDEEGKLNPVGFEWARKCVHWLVERLGRDVYAYLALEKGVAGKRTHCHVLLGRRGGGKFTEANKLALCRLVQRNWSHGKQVVVEPYRPHGGAAQYLVKDSAEAPECGEFIGRPKKLRRRKRGKKQKEV